MMRSLATIICIAAVLIGPAAIVTSHSIKHVVVLMMENRSFDHMLGYMKRNRTDIEGLTGNETNPLNTSDSRSPLITVDANAQYHDPDPCHGVDCTTTQIFGDGPRTADPPPMNGFAQDSNRHLKDPHVVMSMFNPNTVPVISTLANEFALFDHWFASIPGPTMPNRMMAMAASSYGACVNNNISQIIAGYPQKTIFESLENVGLDWRVYFSDISCTLFFKHVRKLSSLGRYHLLNDFVKHAAAGDLPAFSWLEPAFFEDALHPATDQHPSHDVAAGEKVIKKVYEAVRSSPAWNDTLLIITYDEHGGFMDHVPTPVRDVPITDGINCTAPQFDFKRLGVRIPTIAVSPWINKGTLVKNPSGPYASSKFDHTSTLATMKKLFGLKSFLTNRDAWAGTFESVYSQRTSPRTDCPTTLPTPPILRNFPLSGDRPLSDLQLELLTIAASVTGQNGLPTPFPQTEGTGRRYAVNAMSKFLGRDVPLTSLFTEAEALE